MLVADGATLPRFEDLDRSDLLTACAALGFAQPFGMGGWVPLPYSELRAFGEATGRLSTPWEYETVRAMSEAWISGLIEGRSLLSIPPVMRD